MVAWARGHKLQTVTTSHISLGNLHEMLSVFCFGEKQRQRHGQTKRKTETERGDLGVRKMAV